MNANASRAFRYMRSDTLVTSEVPAQLQWLRDCLEPHFSSDEARDGDWRVTFSLNPERFHKTMMERLCLTDEMVPFFALDSKLVALPRWNAHDSEETVAFDQEFGVFFTVRCAHREVEVLAPDLRPWSRVALLRVVRELAVEEGLRAGGIFLHAAAFERDGVAYVIAGPKNAGKTTLLIHALTSGETRFIANDRVLLLRSAKGYAVRGMPTLVSVRAGTRRFFGNFFEPHHFGPDSGCLTKEERELEQHHIIARAEEPLILTYRQFSEALGTTSSIGGSLGAIVFPVISSAANDIALEELPPADACDLLVSARFPTFAHHGMPTAFVDRSVDAPAEREWPTAITAQRIPLLRCVLGPNAYDPGTTAWFDQLQRRVDAP